jgi:hypothetical protein
MLPLLIADEDFIEHLHEWGHYPSIDIAELAEEWKIWSKENVE